MSARSRVAGNDAPNCPDCQSALTFVSSWTYRGLWGHNEVHTYECPTDGPLFITPAISNAVGPDKGPHKAPDDGDRDSLVSARRKPTPTLNADAIAVPEPDSD